MPDRALVAQNKMMIVMGESYPIAGTAADTVRMACDEAHPIQTITFDGSMPPQKQTAPRRSASQGKNMPKTSTNLDQRDMEIVLNFLMSKLSESDMAELDDMLVDNTPTSTAMDARPAPFGRKVSDWVRLGPAGRIEARKARTAKLAADAKATERYHEMFPDAKRLSR